MAIAVASIGAMVTSGAAQTLEVTPPGTIVDNDLLLMFCMASDNQAWTTPETGWTKEAELQGAVGGDKVGTVFRKIASSESGNYTVNLAGGVNKVLRGICVAFSGVNATTPMDVATTTFEDPTGSVDTFSPPAITPVTNGSMIITVDITTQGVSASPATKPSGYTLIDETGSSQYIGIVQKILATAAAETPGDWSGLGSTADSLGLTLALRPAGASSGGGGAVHHHLRNMGYR